MTPTPVTSALSVTGLRKSFGDHVILDGIDLDVVEGSVFSLLGPNGAGKTTAVRIFSTLLEPDGGQVRIGGFDLASQPDKVRSIIGVTGQFSAVDNLLTGKENLMLMANLHHIEHRAALRRIDDLLDRFDLVDAADRIATTYSGGMRRRLDLAMTLIGNPRLIFLDEPTAGLDPRSRRTMWQIIRELVGSGTTVFLTTQDLTEADQLADRVAVLDHGRLVAEGTPDELKRHIPGGHARLEFAASSTLQAAADLIGHTSSDEDKLVLLVPSDGRVASLRRMLDDLDDAYIEVEQLSFHTPDLDDVFFAVTGHPAEEVTAR